MGKKYLIIIGGPTASGKTAIAIEVAKYFDTEIISADSRQFYREMNIGTAKPTKEELSARPHHFINSLPIEVEYSVGDFEKDALALMEQLYQKHDYLVMAGGSGLFIKAVCEGLDEFPEVPLVVKQALEEDYKQYGIAFLQEELKESDPVYFAQADVNNPYRLLRALSVTRASGRPFSSFRSNTKASRAFVPIYIQLDWEREVLYRRINERVDQMMAQGLLAETKELFPKKQLNALQTVGYQELFDFFDGKKTLEEAVEMIKQNSRRYAKRQMTWFRRDDHWARFHPTELAAIIDFIKRKSV